jgi:excisionase family DNA binding protein
MPDEVLTIKEVAALLKLAEETVYAMANAGELPAFKMRGQRRIKRTELDLVPGRHQVGTKSEPSSSP